MQVKLFVPFRRVLIEPSAPMAITAALAPTASGAAEVAF
jgi:hypothetical protein